MSLFFDGYFLYDGQLNGVRGVRFWKQTLKFQSQNYEIFFSKKKKKLLMLKKFIKNDNDYAN